MRPQRPILRLTNYPDPSTPDSLKGLRRHPPASTVYWICFTTGAPICQEETGKKFFSQQQMYAAMQKGCFSCIAAFHNL